MKVSVIIPNYNHERYLDVRIQSILNQTYRDFEIIILDDCSTDNSKAVIERYRKNAFISHIVYNDQNSGSTFKQWEKGFELAKGELIWIAESDDSCESHFLEKLVPQFNDSTVVLAFSRSMQVDTEEKQLGIHPYQNNMNESFFISGINFIKRHLALHNSVVNASSALFRKNILYSVDKDYYLFKGCGDWLFWIHISEKGRVFYETDPLNYFRYHIANTTSKLHKMGNNSKEDHRIFVYLSTHNYLNIFQRVWFKLIRLATYLSEPVFANEIVKKEVLDEWNFSKWDYFLANMLIIYRKQKKCFS